MLELKNISLTFAKGTPDENKVFENFSLDVKDGDFITVIGANGAGKSTMLNVISGNILPDSGKVILNGKDITFMKEHKRSRSIGRLFQDPKSGSAPNMTIEENLTLASGKGSWLSFASRSLKNDFKERLAELGMGLEDRMNSPVGLLSGGQRQALTLLMATYNIPNILLLDEHTAALDPSSAQKVLDMTEKVVSENKLTCIMITHNMEHALKYGNRTLMMNSGKIVLDIGGEEKKGYTVSDLLVKFKLAAGSELNTDRVLLG